MYLLWLQFKRLRDVIVTFRKLEDLGCSSSRLLFCVIVLNYFCQFYIDFNLLYGLLFNNMFSKHTSIITTIKT